MSPYQTSRLSIDLPCPYGIHALSATIPIAVIGTGNAASIYLKALRQTSTLKLAAVGGRDLAKAKVLANKNGIDFITDNFADIVKLNEIPAVILAVPPYIQPLLAIEAFRHGKHVLCEKPLAATLKDAEDICRAWKDSGRIGNINFCYRLIPEIAQFKRLLRSGVCGELHSLNIEWVLSTRLNKSLTYNWKNQRELGGGVLQNYGVHVLDYLFHDETDIAVCCAAKKTYVPTRPDASGNERAVSADEVFTGQFQLNGTVSVIIHLSLVSRPPVGHRILARGASGTLEVSNLNYDSPGGPFSLYRDGDVVASAYGKKDEGLDRDTRMINLFKRSLDAYAESMNTRQPVGPTIEDGLRAARLIETIDQVAGKGHSARPQETISL